MPVTRATRSPAPDAGRPSDREEEPDPDAPELDGIIDRLRAELQRRGAAVLAAPVIGIDRRMLAIRAPAGEGAPWIVRDPALESVSRERTARMEECLCLPGLRVRVPRPEEIVLRGRSPSGRVIRFAAGGELARALQHHMDHLDRILPVDRVPRTPREALPDDVFRPRSACSERASEGPPAT